MHARYEELARNRANHVPLTPLSFLKRASVVYGDQPASTYGDTTRTWAEFALRCRAVAEGLRAVGVGLGDTVSVIAPNLPHVFDLHFAVPLSGGVLNMINTRLERETVAFILDHSDCKVVICDTAHSATVRDALLLIGRPMQVIEIEDENSGHPCLVLGTRYEDLLDHGLSDLIVPEDEWQAISLNYTSGTSGRPKGVVYHHRGAWIMAMGTAPAWSLPQNPVYLSVVPSFHCNGWGHLWCAAILGAHVVFTRDPMPKKIFEAIERHGVTHFGAAPIVLQMLCESPEAPVVPFTPALKVMTAGAPPPPSVLERATALGLDVMQVYGLTETYGHVSQCQWKDEWSDLDPAEQAEMQAMQGVSFPMVEEIQIFDTSDGRPLSSNGQSQGEIAIRGNTVMKGYYKDAKATADAFRDGWFWSGDAAVSHSGGYLQIRDRLKDVIISGGENISSVEVEAVLYRHPAVAAAAVVARPHEKWGESPCAFIELRQDKDAAEADIIAFCKAHLAGFKVPKTVLFQSIPKTSTGKIQKFQLRDIARSLGPQK